ncbi:helix-turn-helix domain-containing protein [Plastoroseomonas arctica]|uniref:Helix-turn-helix transcriptional regulator n=1 Tax=Plastoroseomonas arctica TaxID=1509237 RepID=A0AAF1JXX1_9PROT|nr:helix-turn-helix transcriptional regulator [Plastoroseomonas arctica]MBR0655690.1 helix-turn-helix transcriptional regulator [Plastoroseomonas arctica]
MSQTQSNPPAGDIIRDWRRRRGLSQLDLAGEAGISTRHLSFVETGRASAGRAVLHRLAESLAMPLRTRNTLFLSAGFAPAFPERDLAAPELTEARRAIDLVLHGHAPFPALAVDRHWHMLAANAAVAPLITGVAASLLAPPVNVLRLSLHPDGLAPRIDNLGEWRAHLLERLRHQYAETGDPVLAQLREELAAYPFRASARPPEPLAGIAVPLRLSVPGAPAPLALISTTTIFATPRDVTLAEVALECFYPADAATRAWLTARR